MNAWDRQPGELILWFGRFEAFRLLGTERTIEDAWRTKCPEVAKRRKRPGSAWFKASAKWRWKERAEAWDEAERRRHEEEWRARAEEVRKLDFEAGARLRERAGQLVEQMSRFFERHEALADDPNKPGTQMKVVTVRMAARPGEIAQMAKIASELQRLATGQPTEHVVVDDAVTIYMPDNQRGDAKGT